MLSGLPGAFLNGDSLYDETVTEDDLAPGVAGDLRFVCDQDNRDAELPVKPREYSHDIRGVACIQVSRRLVGEDDRRIVYKRAGDRDTLLFPPGKRLDGDPRG